MAIILNTCTYAKGLRKNLTDALYETEKLRYAVNSMLQVLAEISRRLEFQKHSLNEAIARDEVIIKRNSLPELEPEIETEEGEEE